MYLSLKLFSKPKPNKKKNELFFWLHWEACGVIVPQPRTELMPLLVKAWGPNHLDHQGIPNRLNFEAWFYYLLVV